MDTPVVRPPIPHLTDAYHMARKSYTFAAGVMLAWELVGIELPESFYGLKILSPGAVPYILMVTTGYFFLRTAIEWHQTDLERRAVLAAKVDYILANTIAATAICVFAGQQMLQSQLLSLLFGLDQPVNPEVVKIALGVVAVVAMAAVFYALVRTRGARRGDTVVAVATLAVAGWGVLAGAWLAFTVVPIALSYFGYRLYRDTIRLIDVQSRVETERRRAADEEEALEEKFRAAMDALRDRPDEETRGVREALEMKFRADMDALRKIGAGWPPRPTGHR